MTLTEETYRVGEEYDRLDRELDDLVEKLREADAESAGAQAIRQAANDRETMLGGVGYLVEEHGHDATVRLAGLNAGMFARVQDRAAAMRAQQTGSGDLPGARSNVFAAMVLRDAPFFDAPEDAGPDERLDQALAAVTDQPIGVAKWLESRGNDLTTRAGGDFRRLSERLADSSGD